MKIPRRCVGSPLMWPNELIDSDWNSVFMHYRELKEECCVGLVSGFPATLSVNSHNKLYSHHVNVIAKLECTQMQF